MSKLMSRADAARYFEENGISHAKRKLDEYAITGRGPKYEIIGRSAVYTTEEIEGFVQKLQQERAKRDY
jgi:hypothetical protein